MNYFDDTQSDKSRLSAKRCKIEFVPAGQTSTTSVSSSPFNIPDKVSQTELDDIAKFETEFEDAFFHEDSPFKGIDDP